MFRGKKKLRDITIFLVAALILGGGLYYEYFFTPKNSLELYQAIKFADNIDEVHELFLDGYEVNFTEEDFQYIQDHTANRVGQFTLFEYNAKSYVIMTSPGSEKLKVLAIEELPDEIRVFFSEL
ncbi:hypothetical protein [Sporosarcina koreensis]|uniref:hypothetical protein n=1 Tax=Sporosarcina koreensis TaxID=334735 RepID=UPI00075907AC|nr:hypothetical protein [Sporosarcina koreensis]